jgi:hypothetical protein
VIYEIENFLDESICDDLVKYFNNTNFRNLHLEGYFEDKTLCPYLVEDKILLSNLLILQIKSIQTLSKLFYRDNLDVNLYLEYWSIVQMLPGIDMEVHQDQNHRDYSSVLYLNDNFTGGKTYFPSDNFTCNPKKGKIIFFSSRTYHGVTKVISGERYTLPCWYSKNQNNIYLPQ